jgi:ATP-binding cassette, subfamily C (CFTR/MRP), member 1
VQADWFNEHTKPPTNWPPSGAIKLEGYATRYRPGLDLVLNGVDLDIKAREKVTDIPFVSCPR